MRKSCLVLAGGVLLIAANPAFAQDYGDESVLPDTSADIFSGPHIELSAGLDHLVLKSYKDTDSTQDISASKIGLSYALAVGYDLPLDDSVTLGVEFGLQTASTRWTNPGLVTGKFNTAQVNAGLDVTFGARLGYALNDHTQIYGKLAFANTHFGVTATAGSTPLYDGFSADGVRLGVGLEHQMTRHVYAKLEFDRTQYSGGSLTYDRATPDGSSFTMNNARDQLLGSIGLRF